MALNVGVVLDRLHAEGDEVVIEYDVTNIPAGTLLQDAIVGFWKKGASSALVWIYITPTPNAAGQITDTGGSSTGHMIFRMTGAESALLEDKWRDYVVRVQLDDGAEYTIESGDIRGESSPQAPVQASAP